LRRTLYLFRPLVLLILAALAASVMMAVVLASPAWAANYTVTNTNDSGAGSLRQAMIDATATADPDSISFSVLGSITLDSTLPTVTDGSGGLTINGVPDITISGNDQVRVFEVANGAQLTLDNLTVANGRYTDNGYGGGAIFNNGGTLTVSNSTLSGNSTNSNGGAIFNSGTLTMSNSTLSGNSSFNGGAILNSGTLTMSNSTLSGNSSDFGGAILNSGTLTMSNSTLSGNSTNNNGGAILNYGTLTMSNSTLSGNSSYYGGGAIYNNSGTLTVSNSTLSGNSTTFGSGSGGAIWNSSGVSTLKNTIVANSPSGGSCYGTITDGGYNLDSDNTCGFGTPNSISGVDPMLGPLAFNGGPTKTHALLEGSPAIDKGNSFGATTDQRGETRASNFVGIPNTGDGSDIGAFELQAPDTTPPSVSCSVTPTKLNPSANNHKLANITASVLVSDSGGSGANGFTLLSVTSNQADSGLGTGDVPIDIQGWTNGTADLSGQLRSERYGGTRTYTLTYRGYDVAGNTKDCSATVTVPKGK
jgi:Right handed beta helix region